jgi:hypothetical protein
MDAAAFHHHRLENVQEGAVVQDEAPEDDPALAFRSVLLRDDFLERFIRCDGEFPALALTSLEVTRAS